jgi:hypothetical protein
MAVHVVKKPNPSVNPQVIDMIARSVSLAIPLLEDIPDKKERRHSR